MYLKPLSFIFLLTLLLFACQTDPETSKIKQLEQAITTQATPEAIQQLIGAYKERIQKNPSAAAANSTILGKIADLQSKNNQLPEAVETLKSGIRNYYSTPSTANHLWSLGTIFQDKFKNPSVATAIHKIYQETFPKGANIQAIKNKTISDTLSLTDYIDKVGSNMYNEETHRLDTKIASNFIEICEMYALMKPEDAKSPDYLHKAGETARAIRAFPRAIAIYDRIYANYPDFEKAPQALFLKAFTYDNDLKNFEKAKLYYTEFLAKYPNDDFADDTEFLLGNLGKNDEEIIQSFNKKE